MVQANLVSLLLEGKSFYDFKIGLKHNLGYINKMSVKGSSGSCTLTPDVIIKDPEHPDKDLKVVAILDEQVFWEGTPTTPVRITGRLSRDNQSKLGTCVTSINGGSDIELSWIVVCYDPKTKAYYKRFHTDGKEVKVVLHKDTLADISEDANDDVTEPLNYTFRMTLTAKGEAGKQTLSSARSPDEKVVRQFGGVGS